jgi:hypothetical protein
LWKAEDQEVRLAAKPQEAEKNNRDPVPNPTPHQIPLKILVKIDAHYRTTLWLE